MPAEVAESISRRLLEADFAAAPPRPTIPTAAAISAVAAVLLGAVGAIALTLRPPRRSADAANHDPHGSLATIQATGDARFYRSSSRPDETVHLEHGTIVLEVARLSAPERFRVVTADAEVEVRGTNFEVSASHGQLTKVFVRRGRVEVRSLGGAAAVLDPGDQWVREEETPVAPIEAGVGVRPSMVEPPANGRDSSSRTPVRSDPPALAAERDRASDSFGEAWSLLRRGETRKAALAFAKLERDARDNASAEDASYWEGVALARAGESPEAREVLTRFVGRFPESPRAGHAHVILGWLLMKAGDRSAARSAFVGASRDPSASVRDSALDGLARIDHGEPDPARALPGSGP
jgi:hypothetical protein